MQWEVNHPNIDDILLRGFNTSNNGSYVYPPNHPDLDRICDCNRVNTTTCEPTKNVHLPAIELYAGHPHIDSALNVSALVKGKEVLNGFPPSHPLIHDRLRGMPIGHPNVDDMLRQLANGTFGAQYGEGVGRADMKLYNHPAIDWLSVAPYNKWTYLSAQHLAGQVNPSWIFRRSDWLTAGSLLCFHMLGLLALAFLHRMLLGGFFTYWCCQPDDKEFELDDTDTTTKRFPTRRTHPGASRSVSVRGSKLPHSPSIQNADPGKTPLLDSHQSDVHVIVRGRDGHEQNLTQSQTSHTSSVYRKSYRDTRPVQMTDDDSKSTRRSRQPSNLIVSKLRDTHEGKGDAMARSTNKHLRYRESTAAKLHEQHVAQDPLYDYGEYANLPKPPPASAPKITASDMAQYESGFWSQASTCCSFRIPGTQWATGELLFICFYISLNMWCIYLADWGMTYPTLNAGRGGRYGRAFGSLSVANFMFSVLPATRNNILTWLLGLPFDHVVLYHRAIGRFGLITAIIHFGFYVANPYPSWTYTTGYVALTCVSVMTITSLEFFRRDYFNFFFITHFLFIPFFVFAYLHTRMAQPYILTAIVLYLLDRVLREVWTGLPTKALLLTNKGPDLAQLRVAKSALTDKLGMHKVGQYFFINIPVISLWEWHPYSVSSGPREQDIEFHIRDLGDHTKATCELAMRCAEKRHEALPYIRIDGPYGVHDFNYRKYPTMVLVGGGVGITPVIGMLKDIYNVGNYSAKERRHVLPHVVDVIYAVWVVRTVQDASWFLADLEECARQSLKPQFPKLQTWVYCTRGENLSEPLLSGRPEFEEIFGELDTLKKQYPHQSGKARTFVFSCGPGAMVNELWDLSVVRTARGLKTDFHHETFEF